MRVFRGTRARAVVGVVACIALLAACSSGSSKKSTTTTRPASTSTHASGGTGTTQPLQVTWMQGFSAPGTPPQYNKVGIIKVGPADAKNVLVLEPGTSAGSAYFVPLAKWIVSQASGWQVWSVERRENLFED